MIHAQSYMKIPKNLIWSKITFRLHLDRGISNDVIANYSIFWVEVHGGFSTKFKCFQQKCTQTMNLEFQILISK